MKVTKIIIVLLVHYTFVNSQLVNDDELDKTVPELIADNGYPVETHFVTTPDGYILRLHRIPTGINGTTNNKVVFLQHGLLLSSADWVLFEPQESLGYILADEGYDVWMANSRGNFYSRNHTTLNPDTDSEYWQFSWNEFGEIDLPEMIDYILNVTGVDGVYYAGHSQGTTSFYVMASQRPEYNSKIKVQISLAPVAYMEHLTSPVIRILAVGEAPLALLLPLIGVDEFLPGSGFLNMVQEEQCSVGLGPTLCESILFLLAGYNEQNLNETRVPLIFHHAPAGASTRQLVHYAQEINSGQFRKYDFGLLGNLEQYNSTSPPNYDLSQVTAPVFLIYSSNDWLAAVIDVDRLSVELGNLQAKILVADSAFSHLDFVYGINAPSLVYQQVVSIFSQF